MSRVYKQLIILLIVIVLTGGLAVVYLTMNEEEYTQAAQETEAPAVRNVRLIDKSAQDVERVTFTSFDGNFALSSFTIETAETDGHPVWVYAGNTDVELDQRSVGDMIRDIFSLNAVDTIMEEVANPVDFGIGQIVAAASFTDGSQQVIRLGNMTPDHSSFYMMLEGDQNLYLISAMAGNRLSRQLSDLVDMTLPFVETTQLMHLFIEERGRQPLGFAFTGTQEELEAMFAQFGGVPLDMITPYYGRNLHITSFQHFALEGFEGFHPEKVVELFPEDLAHYGLEDPLLEFIMGDLFGHFHIIIGDNHSDEYVYMMYGGRPHVFLVHRRFIESLLGLNPFNFIDRFVAIMNIVDVDRVTIQSADRGNYEWIINNYVDENDRSNIAPVVNGQEVEEREFRGVYQILIGMSYEHEIEIQEYPGIPDITITYYFLDTEEPPLVVELFAYDANFYKVRRYPNPVQFVTGRLAVDMLFSNTAGLLE